MAINRAVLFSLFFVPLAVAAFCGSATANTACQSQLYASGQRIGAESTFEDNQALIINPSAAKLGPLWSQAERCLNAAFGKKRTAAGYGSGPYHFLQWYNATAVGFEWCSSMMPGVDRMGGSNPAYQNQFSIALTCGQSPQLPSTVFGDGSSSSGAVEPSHDATKPAYYAIAASKTSQQEAKKIATTLGAPWRVANSNICSNYAKGLWVVVAPEGNETSASAMAAKVQGYAKRCL